MSCSSCGSNTGCGCSQPLSNNCNSVSSQCSTDCCDNSTCPVPQSDYSCGTPCLEDHTQRIYSLCFSAVLKVANSWNLPDCGETAVLAIDNLANVHVGGYIWSSEYGYFQIVGYNQSVNQITIQNNCTTGNADPGTQVPACSTFIIAPNPPTDVANPSNLYPYVAIDFTAPANGACTLITLTNVNGLAVGNTVQIGSGNYRINAINDATTIEICNDGAGITPGTPVIAKNASGEFQYPVIQINANACTNPDVSTGALIVCNSGVQQPLGGTTLGSVPVLVDVDTNEVEFQILEVPTRTCTTLTACLTLTTGDAGPYTITVADSSIFMIGDVLQIGSRTDRFTVTGIPDATHVFATVSPVPGAIEDINPGNSLCLAECCELVQAELDDILAEFGGSLTPCSNFENNKDSEEVQSTPTQGIIQSGSTTLVNTSQVVTLNNTASDCRSMEVLYWVCARLYGEADDANTDTLNVSLELEVNESGGGYNSVGVNRKHIFTRNNNLQEYDMILPYAGTLNIPFSGNGTIQARATATWSGTGTSRYVANGANQGLDILIRALGIAV